MNLVYNPIVVLLRCFSSVGRAQKYALWSIEGLIIKTHKKNNESELVGSER